MGNIIDRQKPIISKDMLRKNAVWFDNLSTSVLISSQGEKCENRIYYSCNGNYTKRKSETESDKREF